MKFLIIGDPHCSDKAPACRTETYREDILNKLCETVDIAKDKVVDYVLYVGDLFHRKAASQVSHYLVQRIYDIMTAYPCPVIIIAGNHDLQAGRLDSIVKQPLGVIIKNPNVIYWETGHRILSIDQIPQFSMDIISGTYDFMGDSILGSVKRFEAKNDILVCHMPIAPPFVSYPYPHISSESDTFQRWQTVIYGHQHSNDGQYGVGTTNFINYGSIARGSLTVKSLTAKPAVCIWDMHSVTGSSIIELTSVKPAGEIMRIAEYHTKALREEDVQQFIDSLSESELCVLTEDELIKKISTMDIDRDIKEYAVEILKEQL